MDIYIGGGFNYDWKVVKLDFYGDVVTDWGDSGYIVYDSGYTDVLNDLEIDDNKNLYLAGQPNWTIGKWNVNGDLDTSWGVNGFATYTSANPPDSLNKIVLDNEKNVYGVGYYAYDASEDDWRIGKWDTNGDLDTLWGNSGYILPNSGRGLSWNDAASDIAIDYNKNIYVAGKLAVGQTSSDWQVGKWDANGDLDTSWATSGYINEDYGGSSEWATAIILDDFNNIYVGGFANSATSSSADWLIGKWDSSGDSYDSVNSSESYLPGIVEISGSAGTITLATTTYYSGLETDFLLEFTASNIALCDSLTIDFQSASTTGSISGVSPITISGNPSSATHQISPGSSVVVSDHTLGQVTNTFSNGVSSVNDIFYRYSFEPVNGTSTLATTTIDLKFIKNIYTSDITSANLYVDSNSDGATSSESQVWTDGVIDIYGPNGSVTFGTSTGYEISTTTDFLLELTINNVDVGDSVTFGIGNGADYETTDVCGFDITDFTYAQTNAAHGIALSTPYLIEGDITIEGDFTFE